MELYSDLRGHVTTGKIHYSIFVTYGLYYFELLNIKDIMRS